MNDRVAEWLDAAIRHNDPRPLITLGDVLVDVMEHKAHIWTGQSSCVVTRVSEFETTGEKLMEAWLAGGDLKEIEAAIPQLEAIAKEMGCTQAQVSGRGGWVRLLKPLGYEFSHSVVRKILA